MWQSSKHLGFENGTFYVRFSREFVITVIVITETILNFFIVDLIIFDRGNRLACSQYSLKAKKSNFGRRQRQHRQQTTFKEAANTKV